MRSLEVTCRWLVNLLHTDYSMCNRCAASPSPRVQSIRLRQVRLLKPATIHTHSYMDPISKYIRIWMCIMQSRV